MHSVDGIGSEQICANLELIIAVKTKGAKEDITSQRNYIKKKYKRVMSEKEVYHYLTTQYNANQE